MGRIGNAAVGRIFLPVGAAVFSLVLHVCDDRSLKVAAFAQVRVGVESRWNGQHCCMVGF